MSDIMFLAKKEFDDKLFTETSAEFSITASRSQEHLHQEKHSILPKPKWCLWVGQTLLTVVKSWFIVK